MICRSLASCVRQRERQKKPVLIMLIGLTISTHVQYTQTDTIRQTNGPLVPMVRLVPIEKHPIPMVVLVNMHLIKGT